MVPAIVVTGLDENRRRALVIADNQLALNAEWDEEKLIAELQSMSVDMQKLTGISDEQLLAMMKEPNFEPGTEDDQGKLDELAPKMVTCPHCHEEWDLREHGQG